MTVKPVVPVKIPGGRSNAPPLPGSPGWKAYTRQRWHAKHPGAGLPGSAVTPPKVVAVAPPEDPIMTMFHSTLEQIKANSTPVDEAAIWKPYNEGSALAQGIAGGAAAADATNSQRASDQYGKAAAEAQQRAASFGIASGAGAGDARPDDTQSLLSQQSQAQQNAAVGAGTAWAQLLNRLGTTAVAKAKMDRQAGIDSASMQLSASLPGMYQQADQLAFQKQSQQASQDYLNATLTEKQRAAMRSEALTKRGQDVTIRGQDAADARAAKKIAADAKKQAEHDRLTQQGLNTRAAKLAAKTNGQIKGLDGVKEILKITPGKTQKVAKGWIISVRNKTATGQGYGDAHPQHFSDARPGYPGGPPLSMEVVGTPQTNWVDVPAASKGMTAAQWDKAAGYLYLQNKTTGMTLPQAKAYLQYMTPRPPK